MLKIRFMNISKLDLGKTLKRYKGTAWDQSPLFKKVYEAEYGQFGGEPFGCLVGDYYFDQTPPDVGAARRDGARSPPRRTRRSSPAPRRRSCRWTSWQELANPRDLTKIFTTPEYAALAVAARIGGCALSRPGDAALPVAPAVRRQDQPGRGVRLRGGHRRGRPQPLHLGERRLRDGGEHQPLVQAVRLVLAHPRHRVGRLGRRACRRTPSRPTTAAWT